MKFKIIEELMSTAGQMGGVYHIYKNPTTFELKQKGTSDDNRGMITADGDLFIEMLEVTPDHTFSFLIHDDLIQRLFDDGLIDVIYRKWWLDYSGPIAVQRISNTLDFCLSESIVSVLDNPNRIANPDEELKKNIVPKLEKCKEKNPHLAFYFDETRKEKLA